MELIRSFLLNSNMVLFACLIYTNLGSSITTVTLGQNETDHLSLLAFKDTITDDPFGVRSSWNESSHFCDWVGIQCSNRHKQRVTVLDLDAKSLKGVLSPHIGNLSFLNTLRLQNNFFLGEIPTEISHLVRLQILDLSNNTFVGEIPANISYCSNLQVLRLRNNALEGKIPWQFGSFQRLQVLNLRLNKLTGGIPDSLGNLSSLDGLNVEDNNLIGMIPETLGRLPLLDLFGVGFNQLKGTIPSKIYNLSNMNKFSVTENRDIEGNLPLDIGLTFPKLQWLAVGANRFTGSIPISLLNCSDLAYLELDENVFTGPVPQDLGRLQDLFRFTGSDNNLGTSDGEDLKFLSSLSNCTNLETIIMSANSLRGMLPVAIGNLSTRLTKIHLGDNLIYGSIPSEIGNLVNLTYFNLSKNDISGHIPDTVVMLQGLQELYLTGNNLTGRIPSSLGNLTQMNRLFLGDNKLNGSIPPSIGQCQNMVVLALSYNNLTGSIPVKLFDLHSLSIGLYLSHNALTGPLPSQVGKLINLGEMDVSNNHLSGGVPPTLGECVTLVKLSMSENGFEGTIPESLKALGGLQEFDLSHNNLTGRIPDFIAKLPFLNFLDLSFNDLEGAVPKDGVFRNASAFKIGGNHKLCGGISNLGLPLCPILESKKHRKSLPPRVIVSVVIASTICLAVLVYFINMLYKRRKTVKIPSSIPSFGLLGISYAELVKATDSFSETNLLGVGTYGYVYKGILDRDGLIVAVKVLNLQQRGGSKSFMTECKALRNVRHRNLVKILTVCSSVDFQGNDFKALVFEFMPNGSLDKWLYPEANEQSEIKNLNLVQRLNIAIDVALALDYLHHHSQTIIVHCDLKPSNVLLDSEMTAHVGDFGLAKIISSVSDDSVQSQTNSAVKGTIGYVAPEYGMGGMVSTEGDVYSYGILLLEMFTGKRPIDDIFKDGFSLHSYANTFLPSRVVEIIDPRLPVEDDIGGRMIDCLVAVIKVGVACSMESPNDRMQMGDVVIKLSSIRNVFLARG